MQGKLRDRVTDEKVTAEVITLKDYQFLDLNSTWTLAFQRRHQQRVRDEDSLMWNPATGRHHHLMCRVGLRSYALIAEKKVQGVLLLQIETP